MAVEAAFSVAAGRPKAPHPAMLGVYGLAGPLFPPLRAGVRRVPLPARAIGYGAAIVAVEYLVGRALRRTTGSVPWSYAGARWSVHDVTRLDYLPLWAAYGVLLERVSDALAAWPTSASRDAPGGLAPVSSAP